MEKIFKHFSKKEQPKGDDYEYFKDEGQRHDIYEFSKELTKYIHENSINDVILIDRSARPAWVGIDEYWKTNYPEEKRPSIHFLNPEPLEFGNFLKDENISGREAAKDMREVEKNGSSPLLNKFNKKITSLADEFIKKYKIEKGNPILVFDTCSHTGETINAVTNMLRAGGYEVRIVTANGANVLETDKSLDGNAIMTSCYPFGKDSGVKKGDELTSSLDEKADREPVVTSRLEIRKIIKDEGK